MPGMHRRRQGLRSPLNPFTGASAPGHHSLVCSALRNLCNVRRSVHTGGSRTPCHSASSRPGWMLTGRRAPGTCAGCSTNTSPLAGSPRPSKHGARLATSPPWTRSSRTCWTILSVSSRTSGARPSAPTAGGYCTASRGSFQEITASSCTGGCRRGSASGTCADRWRLWRGPVPRSRSRYSRRNLGRVPSCSARTQD